MKRKKMGILGCGYLGGIVADAYLRGFLNAYELIGVTSRSPESVQALADKVGCTACANPETLLGLCPDIVVETAGVAAVKENAVKILEGGADLVLISIGALADDAFRAEVEQTAARCGRKVYLASGAVGGFDVLSTVALMAQAEGKTPETSFSSLKRPGALKGTPLYREELEKEEGTAFEGTAKKAIELMPTHVNVAVATALALSGPEALKMKMTGRPGFVGDEYFISASGADVRAKLDIYSESSAIAGWSLVALLRNLASPIELH